MVALSRFERFFSFEHSPRSSIFIVVEFHLYSFCIKIIVNILEHCLAPFFIPSFAVCFIVEDFTNSSKEFRQRKTWNSAVVEVNCEVFDEIVRVKNSVIEPFWMKSLGSKFRLGRIHELAYLFHELVKTGMWGEKHASQ